MKILAAFNNKGDVGKTTLIYHLSWMYAHFNKRVLVADFDPQANLTSRFLDETQLETLWPYGKHPNTVLGAIDPLRKGTGDVGTPHIEKVEGESGEVGVIAGDLGLSEFEGDLSEQWPKCNAKDERAFRVISAFYRLIAKAAEQYDAELVLMDVGPNLGAINRAALIASDYIVVPLMPDLFSLQGLRNLGPTVRTWRQEWEEKLLKKPDELNLPKGKMQPIGYVVQQHVERLDRPVKAYQRWLEKIPEEYQRCVLNKHGKIPAPDEDKECLALLKNYQSLMPLAMEARKPVFFLKPADGAGGAHVYQVQKWYKDFQVLACKIAERVKLRLPAMNP